MSAHAELTIDSIAAGGDGVGRHDGIVVFVPRTAPGDRVRVTTDSRKRFARGRLEAILDPSPDRIDPPCAHYRIDRCGGCQIQHLRYEAQLASKRDIIHDTLLRIGKREVDVPAVMPSGMQWRYRTKLTLALRRRGSRWIVGLHPYDDPGAVFSLTDCPITDARIVAVWKDIMNAAADFPVADSLRGAVQLVAEPGAPSATAPLLVSAVIEGGTAWPAKEAFRRAVPSIDALWWKPEGLPRQLVSDVGALGAGASFRQVNVGVGALLLAHVIDRVRSYAPETVIDAYAGIGDGAVAFARGGARVTAIEIDREAAARCRERLPNGSRSLAGRVEEVIPSVLPADVVVLNPPRTGLHEHVTTLLQEAARAPKAIVYVSCDPATLGRDLARMPRYQVRSVRGFDMFPQTAHVETVCELLPVDEAPGGTVAA